MEETTHFFDQSEALFDTLIDTIEVNLNDEQEKQVLGAYLFGMLNSFGRELSVDAREIQASFIKLLTTKFNYSDEIASQFSQFVINSTVRDFHPTVFALIHRGLEAYSMYQEKDYAKLEKDFKEIMDAMEVVE